MTSSLTKNCSNHEAPLELGGLGIHNLEALGWLKSGAGLPLPIAERKFFEAIILRREYQIWFFMFWCHLKNQLCQVISLSLNLFNINKCGHGSIQENEFLQIMQVKFGGHIMLLTSIHSF
ncbi:hypothetical protein ACJX0J_021086 [Zea mays]